MDKLNFKIICRICLDKGKMLSLFKVSMHRKMMAIASIQVWPNDGLPSQICTKCASKLHAAFQLRRLCERSDLKLRQCKIDGFQEVKNNNKVLNENLTILDPVEGRIAQEIEISTTQTHTVFIQPNNSSIIENIQPNQPGYDHFMTIAQNNDHLNSIHHQYNPNNQIQVPTYNIQGHLIYSHQYNLHQPHQHQIQANNNNDVLHSQIIQVELNNATSSIENNSEKNLIIQDNNENSGNNNKNKEEEEEEDTNKACSTCGKIFHTNIKLNRHMKIHGKITNEFPHKCPVCGKGFSHLGNFKTHLRIHNNERPFKCPVCSKGCRQAQDLEKHMRTHTGERPHKCEFCPKAFATSSNLTAHIRTHTGERPYVCSVCQKDFCQSNELTRHMRTHTGEKSHICDICNRGFNGSSGLLTHRRLHTGERPYICLHCNRGFASSNCLTAHIKTHNKLNPIKCGQCDQNFKTLSALKDHMTANHSIGEIIQCKMCDSTFDRVNDYLLHVKRHEHEIITSS